MAATEIVVENEGVRKDKWKIIYLYQMQTADNVSVLIADSSKKKQAKSETGGMAINKGMKEGFSYNILKKSKKKRCQNRKVCFEHESFK